MKSFQLITMLCFLLASGSTLAQEKNQVLSLEQAIQIAINNDPWLVRNTKVEKAYDAQSTASSALPDPKVTINLANLPTDSFDFDQEGMTQFKIGVSQMFPRGDSLELRSKRFQLMREQQPFHRDNRKATLKVKTAILWLEAYKAQESITLIENNRALFEQLADVAQASYSSAVGKTRQHDIVRAQLELTRLDDKLTQLSQKESTARQKLSEWLTKRYSSEYLVLSEISGYESLENVSFKTELPFIQSTFPKEIFNANIFNSRTVIARLEAHPLIKAIDRKVEASRVSVDLAKQKYKPSWGVSASYGYRDDMPTGVDRADLFSVGVTFDLPLFTSNKQDKEVSAAIYTSESVKTEKWSLLRQFLARVETYREQLTKLDERKALYIERLLPQMTEQSEASLTAYTNDDGDFAEVVRSRIAQLNAEIEALDIAVERLKAIVQLNYYFFDNDEMKESRTFGE